MLRLSAVSLLVAFILLPAGAGATGVPPVPVLSMGAPGDAIGCFRAPHAVAVAPDGSVYILDKERSDLTRFTPEGVCTGRMLHFGDLDGELRNPRALTVGPDGLIYIADTFNHRIQVFDPAGTLVRRWASWGTGPGQVKEVQGIALNARAGEVYTGDRYNRRVQATSCFGDFHCCWGQSGTAPGCFSFLHGAGAIAVAPDGTLYVADSGNYRVQRFTPGGTWLGAWGSKGGGPGQFASVGGVAVQDDGTVYVADTGNHRVQIFDPVGSPIGEFGGPGSGPGQFSSPAGLAIDARRRLYVADAGNRRVLQFLAPFRLRAQFPATLCPETSPSLVVAILNGPEVGVREVDAASLRLNGVAPGGVQVGRGLLLLAFPAREVCTVPPGHSLTLVLTGVTFDGRYVGVSASAEVVAPLASLRDRHVAVTAAPGLGGVVLRFRLEEPSWIRLDLYDVQGRHVARLAEGDLGTGEHAFRWDGEGAPAGVYFYRFESPAGPQSGRVLLAR